MSVSTWMKRARVSINYINKMDLFIYISVYQTTMQVKNGVFFSSFSFYFYRSTLAITCQNAIIRYFNSMNIHHPVLSFTNILQVAVPIASFYFLLQRCARDRRPLRVIYAHVCKVGTGLSPSIYYIRVTVEGNLLFNEPQSNSLTRHYWPFKCICIHIYTLYN